MMFFKKMSALLIIASFIFCGEAFAHRTHTPDTDKEASRIARKPPVQKKREARVRNRKSMRANRKSVHSFPNRRQGRALSRRSRNANVAANNTQAPAQVRARRTAKTRSAPLTKRASPVPVEPRTAAAKHNSAKKTYNLSANDIITGLPAAARPNGIEYFRQGGIQGAALHQKEKISHANLVKEINTIEELAKVNPELLGIAEALREHLRKNFGFQG